MIQNAETVADDVAEGQVADSDVATDPIAELIAETELPAWPEELKIMPEFYIGGMTADMVGFTLQGSISGPLVARELIEPFHREIQSRVSDRFEALAIEFRNDELAQHADKMVQELDRLVGVKSFNESETGKLRESYHEAVNAGDTKRCDSLRKKIGTLETETANADKLITELRQAASRAVDAAIIKLRQLTMQLRSAIMTEAEDERIRLLQETFQRIAKELLPLLVVHSIGNYSPPADSKLFALAGLG